MTIEGIEDRLRQTLAAQADSIGPPPDRWHEVEARALARQVQSRRRTWWRAGGLTVVGLAAAVVALVALTALGHGSSGRVVTRPAGHPAPAAATPTSAWRTTNGPEAPAAGSPTTTHRPAGPTPTTSASGSASRFSYLPLYPFRTLQDAAGWRGSYRSGGHQPWHLDPGQTVLSFTNFLGYTNIDTVIGTRMDATGAHVSVGFLNPNGQSVTAAVVHLVPFGTAAEAPWEVVGTDDADFSMATPRYGATTTSPASVGGFITGVDEGIKVLVLQQSSQLPLGQFCCLPAGGTARPWNTTVSFLGATDNVLIIAASTGGHLATVERFTVTGVRTRSGQPTPGL
jgi:hypothetical protein